MDDERREIQSYPIDSFDHGHLSLWGTVASTLGKQVAGVRASQVFGAFAVENNLQVEKKS